MTHTPAQQIELWADRLRHMAASGLHFAPTIYDTERFMALQDLAVEMQAYAGGDLPETLEPLRASLLAHITPFAVADAATIDNDDRLLLIRRADNRLWAVPGGGLDVGGTCGRGGSTPSCSMPPQSKGR